MKPYRVADPGLSLASSWTSMVVDLGVEGLYMRTFVWSPKWQGAVQPFPEKDCHDSGLQTKPALMMISGFPMLSGRHNGGGSVYCGWRTWEHFVYRMQVCQRPWASSHPCTSSLDSMVRHVLVQSSEELREEQHKPIYGDLR